MLNVCFGDSECGMLKQALIGQEVTFSHRLLDIGKIQPEGFNESRREWTDKFFEICSKRNRTKIWKEDCERFDRIISKAKEEKEIRIWYASSASSKCGFYHLVYSLKDIDCRIHVVEMPGNIGFREPPFEKSWGEIMPDVARYCLKLERELTQEEKQEITTFWDMLSKENSDLRVNIDNKITSVSIDYFDEEIKSYAPKDKEFKLANLVGSMIGKSTHCISDGFVSDRIETMIDGGVFVVVGERPKKYQDYYSKTILRLATKEDIEERRKKYDFVENFLKNKGFDYFAIGGAVEDCALEKSYNYLMAHPKASKKKISKVLGIEDYEQNPLPPSERTYTDADFKKRKK